MDPLHLRTFFNSPEIYDDESSGCNLDPHYAPSSSSSGYSKDSGIGLLKEDNLRILEEQTQLSIYTMPLSKNVLYSNPRYPKALQERGCNRLTLGDERKPSNYDAIMKVMNRVHPNGMTKDQATELWGTLSGASSEVMVNSWVLTAILPWSKFRTADHDLRANTSGQWGNGFLLPSRKGEPVHLIAAPNPNATIGYNDSNIGYYPKVITFLGDHSSTVKNDESILFPVFTIEVKHLSSREYAARQNMHNGAIMVRNLRKLREKAGMKENDLKTMFDNKAHVITINFTPDCIDINCCWSAVADDGHLEFFSKPVALTRVMEGSDAFHLTTHKIHNLAEWVTNENKQWIRDDVKKLELLVPSLPPLEPEQSVASGMDTEVTEGP